MTVKIKQRYCSFVIMKIDRMSNSWLKEFCDVKKGVNELDELVFSSY